MNFIVSFIEIIVQLMRLPINYPAQPHTNLLTLPTPYHQSITNPSHNRHITEM